MLCQGCICNRCPHGLQCYICNNELDGHLLISEGCRGDRVNSVCPLEDISPEHAEPLRQIIKARDALAMERYFDPVSGAWYTESKNHHP